MYASTSARRASASIRRAPSRTISSITDDAADRAAPEPSRSAESETTVSIGSYLPDQRCRAGLAWNLSSVTREGTPHPKPIHRFQALLCAATGPAVTDDANALTREDQDEFAATSHQRHAFHGTVAVGQAEPDLGCV